MKIKKHYGTSPRPLYAGDYVEGTMAHSDVLNCPAIRIVALDEKGVYRPIWLELRDCSTLRHLHGYILDKGESITLEQE